MAPCQEGLVFHWGPCHMVVGLCTVGVAHALDVVCEADGVTTRSVRYCRVALGHLLPDCLHLCTFVGVELVECGVMC